MESLVLLISVTSSAGPRDTKSVPVFVREWRLLAHHSRGVTGKVSLTEPSTTLGEGTIRAHVYCWEQKFGAGEGGTIFLSGLNVIFEFCPKGDEDGSELEKCFLEAS